MKTWETQAAAAVVGLAVFEFWKAWRDNAPSLSEVRSAEPGDVSTRQRLLDADITVGSLALIIGVTFAVLTKDVTVLIILLVIFGALSFFHHWTLDAESR